MWGAEWMAEHHWDVIDADYVLTELGGWSSVDHDGERIGHGQRRREGPGVAPPPCQRDARPRVDAVRHRQRAGQGGRGRAPARGVPAGGAHRRPVDRPGRRDDPSRRPAGRRSGRPTTSGRRSKRLPTAVARTCHAHTHTTFSPNVVHGGQKTNTIPDAVDIDVDIRTVPGTTPRRRRPSPPRRARRAVRPGRDQRPAALRSDRSEFGAATRCGTR